MKVSHSAAGSSPSPMHWPRRQRLIAACIVLLLAACGRPEPVDFEASEPPIPPTEAQSDLLDLKAGVQWLSFVPDPRREYPELYRGLDSGQRRRVQVAPHQPASERVVLHFDLPEGSKIWPVQWFGTTLMAIDLPNADGLSVAIGHAERGAAAGVAALAEARALQLPKEFDTGGMAAIAAEQSTAHLYWTEDGGLIAGYGAKALTSGPAPLLLIVEAYRGGRGINAAHLKAIETVLASASIKRDLALEGLPSHKCLSTVAELQRGVLRFPHGTLSLTLPEGALARKTGGDSTITIDGHEASPWMLIRRLDETRAEGDLRARVRSDTAFSRRLRNPAARFSAGSAADSGPPLVSWGYQDRSTEHVLLGVLKAGTELLTIEVVSTGLRDSESRRRACEAALAMLKGAAAEPSTEAPEFAPLVGWNIGTMGRDE